MDAPTHPPTDPPAPPAPLRWLVAGIAVSILLLLVLPVLMLVRREELVASIAQNTPGLSPEWMGWVVVFVMAYSIGLHLLDVIVLVWLTPKVLRGQQWARITLTVCLVIATAGSLYSAAQGGMYLAVVIPTDVLHVLMLALLWAPSSVRRFFAAHRAARGHP